MSDTVVETKGFGTKMKNAFGGIIGGILMFIGGIGLLIYNERQNTINIKDVAELRENVEEVESDKVNNDDNDKLVVTSNKLDFEEEKLIDETFKVSAISPLLVRTVEVYEWVEDKEEDEDSTRYTYEKKWKDELVKSSDFHEKDGHENPTSLAYETKSTESKVLKVGAYNLNSVYRKYLEAKTDISDLSEATLPDNYKVNGKYITNSKDLDKPEVGDIRISFAYANYDVVTVLGKINKDTIDEYITKKKSKISYFIDGKHDSKYVIDEIEKSNNIWKWVLRLIGTLLIIFGIYAFFGPITTLANYIPILGGLVGGALFLASLLLGLAISLLVIAISWIIFRPLLGIALLAVVIVLLVLAKKISSKNKTKDLT